MSAWADFDISCSSRICRDLAWSSGTTTGIASLEQWLWGGLSECGRHRLAVLLQASAEQISGVSLGESLSPHGSHGKWDFSGGTRFGEIQVQILALLFIVCVGACSKLSWELSRWPLPWVIGYLAGFKGAALPSWSLSPQPLGQGHCLVPWAGKRLSRRKSGRTD